MVKFERKQSLLLLLSLYAIVLVGMYKALNLGPLDPGLLRWEGDPMRQGYKIFFFSMQNAAVTYLAFLVLLVGSVMYLRTKEWRWDAIASSSAKLGIVFCTILLLNGAIFSNLAWGAYWNWDPRQTTTLVLWFILAAYLSLRAALEDEETKARLSAILGIFGFVGVPLTHISATIWRSNHPQLYGETPFKLGSSGLLAFMLMLLGALILYAYLLWLSIELKKLGKGCRALNQLAKSSDRQ
ncbi:MAG: cytochrome c biogenesis protein [Candidatus Hydrothermarchaeales archaeon]